MMQFELIDDVSQDIQLEYKCANVEHTLNSFRQQNCSKTSIANVIHPATLVAFHNVTVLAVIRDNGILKDGNVSSNRLKKENMLTEICFVTQ